MQLVLNARNLSDLIQKVNDSKMDLNDANIELREHSVQLHGAQLDQINWFWLDSALLIVSFLLANFIFYTIVAATKHFQEHEDLL